MKDELIEQIARAMCGRNLADQDCETACMASGRCVGKVSTELLADARAAHAVISAKIEELTDEQVERVAKWGFFKRYGSNYAGPTWVGSSYAVHEHWRAEARAALAPHPEAHE